MALRTDSTGRASSRGSQVGLIAFRGMWRGRGADHSWLSHARPLDHGDPQGPHSAAFHDRRWGGTLQHRALLPSGGVASEATREVATGR